MRRCGKALGAAHPPLRQHELAGRTQTAEAVVDAAPEVDRGGAVPPVGRGDPGAYGRRGDRVGQGRQLRFGRHGGIRRGPGQVILLPRNEHAPAGRTSGHRAHYRHRSG